MRWIPLTLYLWPGLPQIWYHGRWWGLGLAAGFAAFLNFLLVTTLVWNELISSSLRGSGWAVLVVVWIGSAILSRRASGARSGERRDTEELFSRAQREYLKKNWIEVERLLRRLLQTDADDPEAGLMLATLFRHTDRLDKARRQLDGLARSAAAEKWQVEIGRELAALDRKEREEEDERPETGGEDEPHGEQTDAQADVTQAA